MNFARVNISMTNDNEKLLVSLLEEFFTDCDINKSRALSSNSVAKYLKSKLIEKGRWKNLSRGKAIDVQKHKENLNKGSKNDCPF